MNIYRGSRWLGLLVCVSVGGKIKEGKGAGKREDIGKENGE